jgi:hypothetical protein
MFHTMLRMDAGYKLPGNVGLKTTGTDNPDVGMHVEKFLAGSGLGQMGEPCGHQQQYQSTITCILQGAFNHTKFYMYWDEQ